LLLWEFIFQTNQTLLPERHFHQTNPLVVVERVMPRWRSLYLSGTVIHTRLPPGVRIAG